MKINRVKEINKISSKIVQLRYKNVVLLLSKRMKVILSNSIYGTTFEPDNKFNKDDGLERTKI